MLIVLLITKQCWVVKFMADTPPCPGGGEHGKSASAD